ncbi:MAG: YlbF family regulator [Clostridia bacterium]|nr:YlbF family regulator [Clostridia bacterium]
MEMFEMARLLGLAIRESDEGKRLEAAKKAYEEDEKIVALTTEFDVQQKALASLAADRDADAALIEGIQARLSEIYDQVLETEVYKSYEQAQKELGVLTDRITTIIMAQVNGTPAGCTHDCSTCGGCH